MEALAAHLLPGETLLWSGRPAQGVRLSARDALLIPFSLLWGGFAVVWEILVLATGRAPLLFALWGIPFVLVGLYLIAGRFVLDSSLRARSFYAVTDRRVLILRTGRFGGLIALRRDALPDMRLSERPDGTGTIRFGAASFGRYHGFSGWVPSLDPTPQFIGIPDVGAVFALLQAPRPPPAVTG